MRDDKLEGSGLVDVVAKGAGAFVGTAVLTGRTIGLCVKSMLAPEQGPPKQAAKKPEQVRAKPKSKKKKKKKKKVTKSRPRKKRPQGAGSTVQRKTAKRREAAK